MTMKVSIIETATTVTILDPNSGSTETITIRDSSIPSGGNSGGEWGEIAGNINDQTDLINQLNSKMKLIGTWSFGSGSINFYDGSPSISIDSYTARNGEMLRVRTSGSKNFGGGTIYGEENDLLYYDNNQWKLIKNFTMTVAALTANSLLATGGTPNQLISLNPSSYPSLTEVSYVKGVTSPIQTQLNAKIAITQKGVANGVAELDSGGLVPASQLPSYVDDVLEYTDFASFPVTGETGKIYIDLATNQTYRWSGTVYVAIGSSLALGETSTTAYRGDRGKIAYDHSQDVTTNPHAVTKTQVGLGNVTDDAQAKADFSGYTAKTTPVDADTALINDSAASGVVKKVTLSNIKSTLKTYFDTLYAAITHTHAQSDITNLTTDLANKQPLDSDLTSISGLTPADDDIIQRKAGAWTNRTMAQLKTDLGVTAHSQVTIDLRTGLYPRASTGSTWTVDMTAIGFGWTDISTGTLGNYFEYDEYFEAGTWDLKYWYLTGVTRGITRVFIDGVQIGSDIDMYSASNVRNVSTLITGFSIATTGIHTIRLESVGKNASATSYKISSQLLAFARRV